MRQLIRNLMTSPEAGRHRRLFLSPCYKGRQGGVADGSPVSDDVPNKEWKRMNSFTATPWPKDRVMPARTWERPAGMRVISSDDHLIEEPGLWENRLKGVDKDRAPKYWKDETGFYLEVDGQN